MNEDRKLFDIHTVVSDDMLRRGIKRTVKWFPRIPKMIFSFCLFLFYSCIIVRYVKYYKFYISYEGQDRFFTTVLVGLIFMGCMAYIFVKNLILPKKQAEKEVRLALSMSGTPLMNRTYEFWDSEIKIISMQDGRFRHIPYRFVNKVYDFSDFIIICTEYKLVFIGKNDLEDLNGFIMFLRSKCPDIKIKKKK